jgi:hypothetical protein
MWHKVQAPAMESQMKMMEETIVLIEREVKATAASLSKAESEERRGGLSSVGTPADLELMLGVLEDKLVRMTHDLEQARRLTYFPAVDGYQLRFSYKDMFLGFKELLLEQLSGSLALSITPGVGADSQAARVPKVVLRLGGSDGNCGSGGGGSGGGSSASGGGEGEVGGGGALLRFLGEGVSLVTRREMLGVSLSPNISLNRINVEAAFTASIPLSYLPRRKVWRPDAGFKFELLTFREGASSQGADRSNAPDQQLLRAVIGAVVEGLLKTLVHRQLGPHLGDFLRDAKDGVELAMDVSVRGVPIRTFDAPLAEWAAGKLAGAAHDLEAAADAARLLGLSKSQLGSLAKAQRLLPSLPSDAGFSSIGGLMRYFRATGLGEDDGRRAALSRLWQETLSSLQTGRQAGGRQAHGQPQQPLPNMAELFAQVGTLARQPATFFFRVRRLRVTVGLNAALSASCDAAAASFASSGAQHSSAKSVLDRFRKDASTWLAALTHSLHSASLRLVGSLRGGESGAIHCVSRQAFFEGGLSVSRLISPPAIKPYAVRASVLADGRLQLLLSLFEEQAVAGDDGDDSASRHTPAKHEPPARPSAQLVSLHISHMSASVMVGKSEALRINLVQRDAADVGDEPPPPPPLLALPGDPEASPPCEATEGSTGPLPGGDCGAATDDPSGADGDGATPSLARDGGQAAVAPTHATQSGSDIALPSHRRSPPSPARPDAAGPPPPPPPPQPLSYRLVEAFENQRRLTTFRPYSTADLLPLDPCSWSDEAFSKRYVEIDLVPLPPPPTPPPLVSVGSASAGGGGGGAWRWVDEWQVDRDGGGKGSDGWQYALNWNTGWLSSSNAITLVRRRRWVRRAGLWLPHAGAPHAPGTALAAGVGTLSELPPPLLSPPHSSGSQPQPQPQPPLSIADDGGIVFGARAGSQREGTCARLLRERTLALDEALESDESGAPSPSPRLVHGSVPARRISLDPSGTPWQAVSAGGGAALLQMSTAPGAHVRMRGQQLELSGQPTVLFDHLEGILQEQLARHPWYAEPLRIACERARVHLGSLNLRVSSALKISASVENGECFITIEGVPEAAERAAATREAGTKLPTPMCAEDSEGGGLGSDGCGTFTNEINLLDLVADVQDIYRSFYENVSGENLKQQRVP